MTAAIPTTFPPINCVGETDVNRISKVRFSFSSATADIRYPELKISSIRKAKLISNGMMIPNVGPYLGSSRRPSKDRTVTLPVSAARWAISGGWSFIKLI